MATLLVEVVVRVVMVVGSARKAADRLVATRGMGPEESAASWGLDSPCPPSVLEAARQFW